MDNKKIIRNKILCKLYKHNNFSRNLLYFACHNTMECNDLEMFFRLGFDCVTIGEVTKNSLTNQNSSSDWTKHNWRMPKYNENKKLTEEFLNLNPNFSGTYTPTYTPPINLTKEFISKFGVIIICHNSDILQQVVNLRSTNQIIIWYSVGQSHNKIEEKISAIRNQIIIVRNDPIESNIGNFCGTDYYTACAVDPSFNVEWLGDTNQIITITRAIKSRDFHTNFSIIMKILQNMPFKIYGRGNENLGKVFYNGGELSFEQLIKCYQHNKVFICGGSAPAPLTYTFQEAMTVGIPIVCLGPNLARSIYGPANLFNMDKYIENGVTGFVSDNINELQEYCKILLNDYDLAKKISTNASNYAKKIWSTETIQSTWEKIFQDNGIL